MKNYKLVVFVPATHGDQLRQAMGDAGAGVIGNYAFCTFAVKGIGRFRPEAGTNPAIGEVGRVEAVEEERIETVCADARLKDVLAAIKRTHPYEEPAIDVYPLEAIE